MLGSSMYGGSWSYGEGYVAVINLDGAIVTADPLLSVIDEALQTDSVKAVVLRVNSPGGSVGASQELFMALRRLGQRKPLVASFGNVAASGAYYAGIAAQRVFVLPGTITASIGVIMSTLDAEGLYSWARLKPGVIKSGHFKDIGSTTREMREDERELLQNLLSSMHLQFKNAVSATRGLPIEQVNAIADGRVITGETAVKLGFADEVGGFDDAVRFAGRLAGLGDHPKWRDMKKPLPWWMDMLESQVKSITGIGKRALTGDWTGGGVDYRWSALSGN